MALVQLIQYQELLSHIVAVAVGLDQPEALVALVAEALVKIVVPGTVVQLTLVAVVVEQMEQPAVVVGLVFV